MKLKDIMQEMAEKIPKQHASGFDPSVFSNFTKLGTIENYDFWMSDLQNDLKLGKLVDENNHPFAYIDLQPITDLNTKKSPFRVRRTWVEPEWRNKGVMTSIYKNLVRKFKIALISDFEFSPETESVWKKLYSELKPDIINSETKETFAPTEFDDIYDNKKYSFILEWSVAPCFEHKDHVGIKDLSVYINRTTNLP